uniref:Uncharacterized protein n=1 Tax=Cacopsylla melanoneura TaxID=428564 RepID=A0A8D9FAJ3_9HEMI
MYNMTAVINRVIPEISYLFNKNSSPEKLRLSNSLSFCIPIRFVSFKSMSVISCIVKGSTGFNSGNLKSPLIMVSFEEWFTSLLRVLLPIVRVHSVRVKRNVPCKITSICLRGQT